MTRFQKAVAKRSFNESKGVTEPGMMERIPTEDFEDQYGDLEMGDLYDTEYWYDQDWEEFWDEYEF